MSRRIVLATFGSLGDLNPFIALALLLRSRGHEPVIATSERHRPYVESRGLAFAPVPPDLPDPSSRPELVAHYMDYKRGTERIVRDLVFPEMKHTYLALNEVLEGADLLIAHPLMFAGRMAAEKRGIKWLSVCLQPMALFSSFDPPYLPRAPWLLKVRALGPKFYRAVFDALKVEARPLARKLNDLRREVGLPVGPENPLFEGNFSPDGTLVLFSEALARQQPDWPPQAKLVGFLRFDETEMLAEEREKLDAFLARGEAPIVFTRGSTAVHDAREFFEVSHRVARRLGQRAFFTVGPAQYEFFERSSSDVLVVSAAPFSTIFPAARVIVHQCGIGTCAQALYAGKPQLLVPHAFDQPDNARRVERLGVGLTLGRGKYSEERVAAALQKLMGAESFATAARSIAAVVQSENPGESAITAIEAVMNLKR